MAHSQFGREQREFLKEVMEEMKSDLKALCGMNLCFPNLKQLSGLGKSIK